MIGAQEVKNHKWQMVIAAFAAHLAWTGPERH